MADNTALSVYDQNRMQRSDRELVQGVTDVHRAVDFIVKKKAAFVALNLTALISPIADADHVHGAGDASTKREILDIGDLEVYLRKVLYNDAAAVTTMTAAQAAAILARYPG